MRENDRYLHHELIYDLLAYFIFLPSDGIGGALLGTAAERTVPMTSTPFISSSGDLATLMVFIDPTMPSAYKTWWKEATKRDPGATMIEKVKSWRRFYFLRRDQDILCNSLSVLTETVVRVQCSEPELVVYKRCEQSFITTFEGYKNSSDPGLTLGKKDLTDVLLLHLIKMVSTLTIATIRSCSIEIFNQSMVTYTHLLL